MRVERRRTEMNGSATSHPLHTTLVALSVRSGEDEAPWSFERRRRRTLAVVIAVTVLAVAIAATLLVNYRRAVAHYEAGTQALARRDYGAAVAELAQARILKVPYADSEALMEQAETNWRTTTLALAERDDSLDSPGARLRRKLAAAAHTGRYDAALALLAQAERLSPTSSTALGRLPAARGALVNVATWGSALAAVAAGDWPAVRRLTSTLLARDPGYAPAAQLRREAQAHLRAADLLTRARASVAGERWRDARRLVLDALALVPGFGPAQRLLSLTDSKLAAAAAPAAAPATAAAATAAAPEPAPKPAPKPTMPPPP